MGQSPHEGDADGSEPQDQPESPAQPEQSSPPESSVQPAQPVQPAHPDTPSTPPVPPVPSGSAGTPPAADGKAADDAPAHDKPAAATDDTPTADDDSDDDEPYEPRVRAYEQRRVVGTVSTPWVPSPTAAPTEAIPAVASPSVTSGDGAASGGTSSASSAGTPGTPLDGLTGDGAPSRLPKVLLGVGIGAVVLGGLYVGLQWFWADTVPSGTTVAGVDIGGLDAQEATSALEQGLGPRAAEPITVQAGETTSTVDPAEAGLNLDAAATVGTVTGFSLSPSRLVEHLGGGDEIDPVIDTDRAALESTVSRVAESLAVEPVDGTVRFVDGEPTATDPADGTQVVADSAGDAIVDAWLVTSGPIELPTEAVTPTIDQADTDAALAEAREVVSGPVTVEVGEQSPEVPPRVLARSTSFVPQGDELEATFDGERLTTAIVDRTNDLLQEPDDAHFEFSGGEPVIVGGQTGTTLDPEQVADAVGPAALSADQRTAQVELVEEDPENSRESLEELGVDEVISEFSTPLTSEPIRTKNLVRGAELVNGTLVKPGETFSLIEALSPIEVSNGYYAAGVVNNGIHSDAVGGGLSQMATTTYNAGFFAGFDDVEHRQHSYWFSRYPAGREATIYVGSIDMKFKNDTPYGALMQSYVSGGRLHVRIWSTEHYDVEASDSGKQEIVPTKTVDMSSNPDCEPYSGGQDGFAITVYRKVYLDGDLVKDESDFWRYKPDDAVTCTAPQSEDDDEEEDD